ncbi:MAG: DUF3048 domain-containing protein [Actinomycetales bacterium]|nr:DUF3048 domain-containing protein [Actinomycetales bacterium]
MTTTDRRSPLPRRLTAGAAVLAACALSAGALGTAAPAGATTTVLNPLTGLRVASTGPVVAIKVANTPQARPQSGLRSADQVWVEEQEGGWTRFIAVYGSTYPTRVGPVRSARETDLIALPQFGKPALAYAGADTPVANLIASSPRIVDLGEKATVNGVPIRPRAYYVDKTRKVPYNFYSHANILKAYAAARAAAKAKPMGFVFGRPKAAGRATRSLGITWAAQTSMLAVWNRPLAAWVMYWKNGRVMQPLVERESKKLVTAKNIVVMRVAYSISRINRSTYRVPVLKTVGRGGAIVLRNGARWTGTWARTSLTGGTFLRDTAGRAMTLTPGQTWVFLVPYGRSLNKPYVMHSVTVR